eukprot:TRINITY_DN4351_c1_g2_i1.p1 TRINITY_DN4351_c1_g2~~TRINITY_DN4351_c1_g2_i1.p1  ORF type:complete len:533 (-),score=186.59 TRINITY_DN4351_c1_g2_i1:543-2141(-)
MGAGGSVPKDSLAKEAAGATAEQLAEAFQGLPQDEQKKIADAISNLGGQKAEQKAEEKTEAAGDEKKEEEKKEEKKEEEKKEEAKKEEEKKEEKEAEKKEEAKEESKDAAPAGGAKKSAESPSVAIIYYSTYGHIKKLADFIKGSLEANGVNVDLFQVPETLNADTLKAIHAPEKASDVMTIDYPFLSELPKYDGFMFGYPTRFGTMCGQMKTFLDSTGSLWMAGALAGKPVATFVSTGTQGGGQETSHYTALTNFVHHGMMYVPMGYAAGADQFNMEKLHGGSPWGASTYAGPDGSRQPNDIEENIAKKQGEVFAAAVKRSIQEPSKKTVKICLLYYTTHGHMKKMVDEFAAAMKATEAEVDVFQVPEILSEEVLKKMKAIEKPSDPVMGYDDVSKLEEYDGIVFGIPTHFGSPAAQIKAFLDATGGLWQAGKLCGKPVTTIVSSGSQNGGQETTHLTALTNFVHHGMIHVPLGYQAGDVGQFDMEELHGGSPWGASLVAGQDASRPTELELKIARRHGEVFAKKVKKMAL